MHGTYVMPRWSLLEAGAEYIVGVENIHSDSDEHLEIDSRPTKLENTV